jgi:hypothetical protein
MEAQEGDFGERRRAHYLSRLNKTDFSMGLFFRVVSKLCQRSLELFQTEISSAALMT